MAAETFKLSRGKASRGKTMFLCHAKIEMSNFIEILFELKIWVVSYKRGVLRQNYYCSRYV